MSKTEANNGTDLQTIDWRSRVAEYHRPQLWSSIWQLVNSVIPYFILWYLMYLSLEFSYWLTLGLAVLAAGFLTRTFIIFHDCGHNAFFKSKKANNFWGWMTGLLTFTPFKQWRHDHAVHHATSGDLDRRGVGEVWTLTVREYERLSRPRRFAYRVYRNPIVLFGVGALYYFLIRNRFPTQSSPKSIKRSVYLTNFVLLLLVLAMGLTVGFVELLLVQAPIWIIAMAVGVWLFYVQHQFEDTYWSRHEEWAYVDAALQGSSFYKLPKILQWFTGSIGFHHIHHLSPRIPNYHLQRCHDENRIFNEIKPVTLLTSLKALNFRLWDEEQKKLVGFKAVKALPQPEEEMNK